MTAPSPKPTTAEVILDAARTRLLADGYARLSTRKVAHEAGVPLSQVHYHFGSKGGMVLALLEAENQRRLARQAAMYAEDAPLWRRYEQACDFLEDDLESGYVRVLQEMIAAGWSDPRDRRRHARDARRLVRAAQRRRHRSGGQVRRSRPVLTGRGGRARSSTPSSAPRRCSCSASTATRCRSGPACAGSVS